jgi:hypothetical protein
MACPARKEVNAVTSPPASDTSVNAVALAANRVTRRGCTVSEVRIIPVEYSDVKVSAPSAATAS